MKLVVIGGTGLIGSNVVATLTELGHHAIPASPHSGVDAFTGEGLGEALTGAHVVIDVSNSPSFDDEPVMSFFTTSTTKLLAAERAAGVGHHVLLSIVGADRLPDSGYYRAKVAQEELIKGSATPYSIVRATQFFEFGDEIADSASDGDAVRLSPALVQPMAAEDVATAVARSAIGQPVNRTTEVAGPEMFGMDDFVRVGLIAKHDRRRVVTDPESRYFGALIDDNSLVPGSGATIYPTRLIKWLAASTSEM